MASVEATQSALASSWNVLKMTTANVTSIVAPSPKDLLLAVPRMAARAGSYVTESLPEAFENLFGGGITGRAIAEVATERVGNIVGAVTATTPPVTAPGDMPVQAANANPSATFQAFTFSQIRAFGGIFSYMTSKWALGCVAAAIVLNRTSIYAASRRHLRLHWQVRAALRSFPIVLLHGQAISLLRAIRCQTSPDYTLMRYGARDKNINLDFAGGGGFLYGLSSLLLLWEPEEASCLEVSMIPTRDNPTQAYGSLSLLWPAFLTFCFSQFAETLICAVEGRTAATENGMSLFEHSLAFAEAEAMVGTQISYPSSNKASSNIGNILDTKNEGRSSAILPIKAMILQRFNTPPEVLLMALISCLNNLCSHVLGVFGMQARYRLLNTGFWGLCFMASFIWGFWTMTIDEGLEAGLFRFPTVCVVGFIPHILILSGIFLCGCIYNLALVLSVLCPPEDTRHVRTWRQRFQLAHQNMQANSQLSGLRLHRHEDFYTALLRVGFGALMAASDAVFLNEEPPLYVRQWTWWEEEMMEEILRTRTAEAESKGQQTRSQNGFNKERSVQYLRRRRGSNSRNQDMVGAFQRSGRYLLALSFLTKIFWLSTGWTILALLKFMTILGIEWRPEWVKRMFAASETKSRPEPTDEIPSSKELEFWILSDEGKLLLPPDDDVDVEAEIEKRLRVAHETWGKDEEALLDTRLYDWFTHNGWWGQRDSSGDYQPPHHEDDTTSVISTSTDNSESDWESDSSGRRTPTLRNPNPSIKREPTNDTAIDPSHLAKLLSQQTTEERDEARLLAAHLATPNPLTRNQFSRILYSGSVKHLTAMKFWPANFQPSNPSGELTPLEEAEIVELQLERYKQYKERMKKRTGPLSSNEGTEGLGSIESPCVVCQSASRTIVAWPCKCLCVCEDCRVNLAMNNFSTCVTCRQEVTGFSRLYIP